MEQKNELEVVDRVPLNLWRDDMAKIAGEWNGDEPGIQEERAHAAEEAIELIEKLNKVLNELDY